MGIAGGFGGVQREETTLEWVQGVNWNFCAKERVRASPVKPF